MKRYVIPILLAVAATVQLGGISRAGDDSRAVQHAAEELERCIDRHANDLIKLARRLRKKDPAVAVRALKKAFALRPGCSAATKVAKQIGVPDLERTAILFDGQGLAAFRDAALPTWSQDGPYLRADAPSHPYVAVSYEQFEGDYTVRMEARVAQEYDGPSFFAIGGDSDDPEVRLEVGIHNGRLMVLRQRGANTKSEKLHSADPATLRPPVDPGKWNCYELRFVGNRVLVYVNGRHVVDVERSAASGGSVTLVAQHIAFLARLIEVVRQ